MDMSTEQSILNAAEKLFLEKGFATTSTAQIAREAGCNTALIHYYYRTKLKLFETIFHNKIRLFIEGFVNITQEESDFQAKIVKVVETHFDFMRANKRLPFLLINEFATNPDSLRELKNELLVTSGSFLDIVQRQIDDQVSRNIIRPVSAIDLIFTIGSLNAMTFIILPVIDQLDMVDQDEFIANRKSQIVDTIVNSLKI